MDMDNNFIEIFDVREANKIDLKIYTFVRFSETRNKYIFKKRQKHLEG